MLLRRPHDISNESLGVFRAESGVLQGPRNRDSKSPKVSTTRVLRVTAKKEQCCHNLQKAANRTQATHARVKICNDFSRHRRNNPIAGGSIKIHSYQFWFKAISRGCFDSGYLVGWSRQSNVLQITGRDIGRGCLELVVFVIVLDARSAED